MKVILLEDVANIGKKYDIAEVKDGLARNLLIPQKKAIFATPETENKIKAQKAAQQKQDQEHYNALTKVINELKETPLTITANANEEGHLYSAVSRNDIAEALAEEGKTLIEPTIITVNTEIKSTGEHTYGIVVGDTEEELPLIVQAQE